MLAGICARNKKNTKILGQIFCRWMENETSGRDGEIKRETYLFASLGLFSTTTTTTGTCRSFMNKFFPNETKNFKTNETIANESFRRGSLIKEK